THARWHKRRGGAEAQKHSLRPCAPVPLGKIFVLAVLMAACPRPRPPGSDLQPGAAIAIRVNQIGYLPEASKVAVACALEPRSVYNPVFHDSVHKRTDGVLVDHPTRSGEFIPVSGGWADASDYLQYGATTAHATTMLLLAYRDHPGAFRDGYQASGLPGAN